jgi:hypothetical protein
MPLYRGPRTGSVVFMGLVLVLVWARQFHALVWFARLRMCAKPRPRPARWWTGQRSALPVSRLRPVRLLCALRSPQALLWH